MSTIDQESFAEALAVYALQEVARDQGLKAHPTPEKLAAYHADELSETEDLEIQRHLAICSECPALLIDLEDLFEPRQRDLGLSDTGVASAWRDLRSRIGGDGSTGGPRAAARTPWWAWFSAAMRSPVLASGLAVLCVGLTVSLIQLRENDARPVANLAVVELISNRTRSGGVEERSRERVELVDENDGIELIMELQRLTAQKFERFTVRILDERGDQVGDDFAASLRKPPRDLDPGQAPPRISAILRRKALDPGLYTVKVFGRGAEHSEPLETFPIEVVHI